MRAAAAANDPARGLTVLGISLHQVQDFYAHTNWLEPKGMSGYDGPGWQTQGRGTTPTWFDIPADVRLRERIYSGGSPGIARSHGPWNAAVVDGLGNSMNKDWPGRPLYDEAYMAAYFASRQWVQAVRSWLNNEAFWNRMRAYGDRHGGDLAHDVEGATDISFYSGHWQGQGEPGDPLFRFTAGPGGSLDDLAVAMQDYFEPGRTFFRRTFESTIEQVADPSPPGALTNVPSSRPLQQNWRFVKAQILHMNEIDDMDVSFIDEADFYALAGIAGQRFRSGFIHGYDSYDFKRPNFPFTFVKAIRKGALHTEPLRDLRIKVATSNAGSSGTNDDVYLRINNNRRFLLDKPLYDDFESGDRDTYSLPIDALENAPAVSDVQFLQLEKSKDGFYGGWKLHGITVWINDRQVYNNLRIDTWLEDDHRTWRAPDFKPLTDTSRRLPIWLTLYDDDGFLYGNDDHVDLYPLHARKNVAIAYEPGQGRSEQSASGGDKYGGRWPSDDDDKGRIRYRIETLTPITPP